MIFFNSVFLSIDVPGENDMIYDIPDESEPYNQELLNMYLMSLLQQHLKTIKYFEKYLKIKTTYIR